MSERRPCPNCQGFGRVPRGHRHFEGSAFCTVCGAGPVLYDDEGLTPIPTENLLASPLRFMRERQGFHVVVGPWAARFSWGRTGWFANGSHWFSGWHRWMEDDHCA